MAAVVAAYYVHRQIVRILFQDRLYCFNTDGTIEIEVKQYEQIDRYNIR